jgi:hypothetical protein
MGLRMTTTEPEPTAVELPPDEWTLTQEERLRSRVSMLTQLLILAGVVVVLQFGVMLKD